MNGLELRLATVLGGGDASHAFWYLSRAAGLTAYALLTADVALGLAVRTRRVEAWLARWRAFDLHRLTALLALACLALHVFALLGDRYIGFRIVDLLVPFASPYRPVWTALGVFSLYLLVAIVASFYVRRLIGHRAWRTLHYATFGAFALALTHGVFAGTDAGQPWAVVLYLVTGGSIAALAVLRFRHARSLRFERRDTALAMPALVGADWMSVPVRPTARARPTSWARPTIQVPAHRTSARRERQENEERSLPASVPPPDGPLWLPQRAS